MVQIHRWRPAPIVCSFLQGRKRRRDPPVRRDSNLWTYRLYFQKKKRTRPGVRTRTKEKGGPAWSTDSCGERGSACGHGLITVRCVGWVWVVGPLGGLALLHHGTDSSGVAFFLSLSLPAGGSHQISFLSFFLSPPVVATARFALCCLPSRGRSTATATKQADYFNMTLQIC